MITYTLLILWAVLFIYYIYKMKVPESIALAAKHEESTIWLTDIIFQATVSAVMCIIASPLIFFLAKGKVYPTVYDTRKYRYENEKAKKQKQKQK